MSARDGPDHPRARRNRLRVVGYDGEIRFDRSKPDGTPRKLMDSSRLAGMGWTPKTGLEDGFRLAYAWYLANERQLQAAS